MKPVLTIAGSDSGGGAGIQADIKTIMANGCYAMSAITALTAQNTMGVTGIQETTPEMLALQLDAVFTDIRPDVIKIGMVASEKLISVIADRRGCDRCFKRMSASDCRGYYSEYSGSRGIGRNDDPW